MIIKIEIIDTIKTPEIIQIDKIIHTIAATDAIVVSMHSIEREAEAVFAAMIDVDKIT